MLCINVVVLSAGGSAGIGGSMIDGEYLKKRILLGVILGFIWVVLAASPFFLSPGEHRYLWALFVYVLVTPFLYPFSLMLILQREDGGIY